MEQRINREAQAIADNYPQEYRQAYKKAAKEYNLTPCSQIY
jgi:hypothetical protein